MSMVLKKKATTSKNQGKTTTTKRRSVSQGSVSSFEINGGKYSPNSNPPDSSAQPWYPLVVSSVKKSGKYTFETLTADFRRQLDPTGRGLQPTASSSKSDQAFRFQFRLRSVAVWNLTGTTISLSINELRDSPRDVNDVLLLGGWTDCGGNSAYPRVGYKYPHRHSHSVHRPDDSNQEQPILWTTASSDKDSILLHLNILWRFDGPTIPPFNIAAPVPGIVDLTTEVKDTLKDLAANQPSKTSVVVDKIAQVASFVVPVAAGPSVDQELLPASDKITELIELLRAFKASNAPSSAEYAESDLSGEFLQTPGDNDA